ncbi:Rad4-domain-containing protein [Thozetella sp. PMI_491]|nr:Rad4-domain-containing protein [Thozetella sp. PMI_491]
MGPRKRSTPGSAGRRSSRLAAGTPREGPTTGASIYREMIQEARAENAPEEGTSSPERPRKRKRPGDKAAPVEVPQAELAPATDAGEAEDDEDEDDEVEFEDVVIPMPTIQTITRDSDDEDDEEEEVQFEDVDLGSLAVPDTNDSPSREITLNLSAQKAAMTTPRRAVERRKAITKSEKERRFEVHKMHLLCLISHVERRNHWCNDTEVQDALEPLLTGKMVKLLNPRSNLTQFGQTESLKNGLQEARAMFRGKFKITERGMKRALWAEDEAQLKAYNLPEDIDSTLEKAHFIEAAKNLEGSRDVGVQLFCALLRCAGVDARLVCSLQPLSFAPNAPTMPKQRGTQSSPAKMSKAEVYAAAMAKYEAKRPEAPDLASSSSPRRRLGHLHAAGYNVPSISQPTVVTPPPPATKKIRGESPFPIYWIEVLDVAHQKWQPADPLVKNTQFNTDVYEPPASDRENCMSYVIAFEPDGTAKDVTRRYAKAYNSKTRKMRIDGAFANTIMSDTNDMTGEKWLRKVMRRYRKPSPTDVDQIEDTALGAAEMREPMPRNVADFKDHPIYALERHLRRHEVLVPGAERCGTVGAGSKGPLENVYRRRDVRIARSRDKWYRMGREVKPGEEPVKMLPKRARRKSRFGDDYDEEDDDPDKVGLFGDEIAGTPIYMFEQTELYHPPPVVDGKVPKNKFGNLDVYVPSMIPPGGVHIVHDRAREAAFILGIDYAPALTGFQFKGRQGTAVLTGVIIPQECEDGVRAALRGLAHLDAERAEELRSRQALRMWSRLLKALRIRERIFANVDPDEEAEAEERGQGLDKGKGVADDENIEMEDAPSDVSEEIYMVEDDEGGGFLVGRERERESERRYLWLWGGARDKLRTARKCKPSQPLPKNWPQHIPYLTYPLYSPKLTKHHFQSIRTRPPPSEELADVPRDLKPGPCPLARITPITDPRHPACGQSGLYAARDLRPGELILPYLGEVHVGNTSGEAGGEHADSDYDLWLDHGGDVAVDAARTGNEARFVNDYRGVPGKERPNAEFRAVWDPRFGSGAGERGMAVFVLPAGKKATGKARSVGIAKGEEILVSYGKGFWERRRAEETG